VGAGPADLKQRLRRAAAKLCRGSQVLLACLLLHHRQCCIASTELNGFAPPILTSIGRSARRPGRFTQPTKDIQVRDGTELRRKSNTIDCICLSNAENENDPSNVQGKDQWNKTVGHLLHCR